jgi:Na+-translocating ferredoxin:NAD+ oxidoreductase subunit B
VTVLTALILMTALAGFALCAHHIAAAHSQKHAYTAMIERIDDLLPQTQCGRCTFSGCRPYATALALGAADINQCPPGGDATAAALAKLLARPAKSVDPRYGIMPSEPMVAWIREADCIGCTKCIQACPVDAIVGASRYMHTIIAAQCTGCELCIPPCPVDCIEMRPARSAFASPQVAQPTAPSVALTG